jgi:4,5-DOPA dioxygenase extradiol
MSDNGSGKLHRRDVLRLAAAGAALAASGTGIASAATKKVGSEMPVIFAAHGNPMFLDDALFMRELRDWAVAMPRPKAVLMVSAHWEERPVTLGATRTVPLVYDFGGFPQRYYEVKYPAPGAPQLAARVRELLNGRGIRTTDDPGRGLDHGAYVPMVCMYPKADVPVLQLSLPSMNPQEIFAMGMALAPLRKEGVLIIGSGFLTHNLRRGEFGPNPKTPSWASEFDAWAEAALSKRDFDSLLDYRAKAPGVQIALPTHEHYVPVLVAAGASSDRTESVKFPITGYMAGSFTKRSVQFG